MRRYPRGTKPQYDRTYGNLFTRSWVINEGLRTASIELCFHLKSKESCEGELLKTEGNKDGKYWDGNTNKFEDAMLPLLQEKLKEKEAVIPAWHKRRFNQGYEEGPPPQALVDDVLVAEAKLDVCKAEIKHLKKMIAEFEETKAKEKPTNVLIHGPECGVWQGDDVLHMLDYQRVGFHNGVLIITDDRPCNDGGENPYRGMCVVDYRKMSARWKKQRKAEFDKKYAAWKADPEKDETTLRPPGGEKTSRANWPEWPHGAINYLKAKKIPAK